MAAGALKKAEKLTDKTTDTLLQHQIATLLFLVNYYYGNRDTALEYAHRTRRYAMLTNDSVNIYRAISFQGAAILEFGRLKEAIDTMKSSMRYAPALNTKQKARMYNNLRFMFKDSDINIAKEFYEKSISLETHKCCYCQSCICVCPRRPTADCRLFMEKSAKHCQHASERTDFR